MNTTAVAKMVEKYNVITIKADKTRESPEIDKLLVELGNVGRGIPFYAIYPGKGGDPILLDGLVFKQKFLDALEEAGPSQSESNTASPVDGTNAPPAP